MKYARLIMLTILAMIIIAIAGVCVILLKNHFHITGVLLDVITIFAMAGGYWVVDKLLRINQEIFRLQGRDYDAEVKKEKEEMWR